MVDNGIPGRSLEDPHQNESKADGVTLHGITPNQDRDNLIPIAGECSPGGLTSIRRCIHCSDTEDAGSGEMENLAIEAFLDTLAQVSLSIASRTEKNDESGSLS